jgi:hypothetical protein
MSQTMRGHFVVKSAYKQRVQCNQRGKQIKAFESMTLVGMPSGKLCHEREEKRKRLRGHSKKRQADWKWSASQAECVYGSDSEFFPVERSPRVCDKVKSSEQRGIGKPAKEWCEKNGVTQSTHP